MMALNQPTKFVETKTIDMKNYTEYWKQTCIDFAKYAIKDIYGDTGSIDGEQLWEQFQEQMAEDVMDVLDEVEPNDKLKEARLKESVEELEFGSTQDKINHEILQLIAENNALQEDRWKKNKDVLMKIHDVCELLVAKTSNNTSLIKLTDTMVSANNIALNNIEKDLYQDEKFVFNEKSYKESNKQIKCYCGHTTTCDCEPLNRFEKAEQDLIKSKLDTEPETKQMDIADAVEIMEDTKSQFYNTLNYNRALETCIAWIKAELHDKKVDDLKSQNESTRTGKLTNDTGSGL